MEHPGRFPTRSSSLSSPKRVHHHIGIEHMVPRELMEAKVRESVAALRNEGFLIIARTNGVRSSNMDDALR